MIDYYEIGQRVRRYRKACKLSQEELAGKVDISATHMSHIETGDTKLSLPVLVKIADALSVQTDALIFDQPQFSKTAATRRAHEIFETCTTDELYVLLETMESLKVSLNKHMN